MNESLTHHSTPTSSSLGTFSVCVLHCALQLIWSSYIEGDVFDLRWAIFEAMWMTLGLHFLQSNSTAHNYVWDCVMLVAANVALSFKQRWDSGCRGLISFFSKSIPLDFQPQQTLTVTVFDITVTGGNLPDYTQFPLEPRRLLYNCFHICSSTPQDL